MQNILKTSFLKLRYSKSLLLGLLACLVGLFTGAGIWLFKYLYNLIKTISYLSIPSILPIQSNWLQIFVPAVGGLLVGLLMRYFGGKEKVGGTAGIIQAVEISGGRLRYQHLPAKTGAAILSIGTGASVGPEDPSVQIGTNIGSLLGQVLHLAETQTVTLVAAGAAAAIAAAFNAPIAGVFFALEIVIGDISGSSLGMVLVSAVVSSVLTQALSGTQPAFQIQPYSLKSAWELLLYFGLGLLSGPVSAAYIRMLYWMQDMFHKWTWPRWAQTALAGLVIGCIGLVLPQVLGVGYDTITAILNKQQMTFWFLLILMAIKLILTTFSIGSGFVGGVFAPSLFIGATLGGAFGMAMNLLFPVLGISPSAYALVGMAAVLAGSIHAPLTASILLFEMTGDYRIILPLMLSVAVSMLVSQKIQPNSVYSLGLVRKGFYLNRGKEIDLLDTMKVGEVMKSDFAFIQSSESVFSALKQLRTSHENFLNVVTPSGELAGILTLSDIEKMNKMSLRLKRVGDYCQQSPVVTNPQDSLSSATRKMSDLGVGQLPVVAADDPKRIIGILRREDIIQAYSLALKRRLEQRHSMRRERLDAVTPEQVSILEFVVQEDSSVAGKKLKEIEFPAGCIVASVRRGTRTMIPNGDTLIKAGDSLVLVASENALDNAKDMFQHS
jgi:CIC family chloride channel protein